MPAVRYMNDMDVQGWEPGYGTNAVGLQTLSKFGGGGDFSPGRQAPSRAWASASATTAYPTSQDFTFQPAMRGSTSSSSSAAYCPANLLNTRPAPTSSRSAAAAGRNGPGTGARPRTSTERKIARKLAENANYVPRPKNSFILFRTEFVAQRTAAAAASRVRDRSTDSNKRQKSQSLSKTEEDDGEYGYDEDGEEAGQSLSKQASAIWNKMTEAQKRPWMERAKLEKAAHEAKYPHYRYKPTRHGSSNNSCTDTGSAAQMHSPAAPMPGPKRPGSPQRTLSESSTLVGEEDDKICGFDADGERSDEASSTYYSSAASTSSTIDVTLQMPAPIRMLALPNVSASSSSLANALGSPTPTWRPAPAHDQASIASGLSLPIVPPVPTLNFADSDPSSSYARGLPPVPRSPSAPVFDSRTVGQFCYQQPQQQAMPAPSFPTSQPTHSSSSFTASQRASSCPSTPQVPVFAVPDSQTSQPSMSPLTSRSSSELTLQSAPTPPDTVPDYFGDFVTYDGGDASAAPASLFMNPQRLYTINDSNCYDYDVQRQAKAANEHDAMDIDMHTLLNLSPVPEVSESAEEVGTDTAQRPFDAVAALWEQDLQQQQQPRAGGRPQSDAKSQAGLRPTNVIKSRDAVDGFGLGTYALAVSGGDFGTANQCSTSGLGLGADDLFRDLDLNFGFTGTGNLSCTSPSASLISPLSPSNVFSVPSNMSTTHPEDDLVGFGYGGYGYDREHGLYRDHLGTGPGLASPSLSLSLSLSPTVSVAGSGFPGYEYGF